MVPFITICNDVRCSELIQIGNIFYDRLTKTATPRTGFVPSARPSSRSPSAWSTTSSRTPASFLSSVSTAGDRSRRTSISSFTSGANTSSTSTCRPPSRRRCPRRRRLRRRSSSECRRWRTQRLKQSGWSWRMKTGSTTPPVKRRPSF